MSELDFFNAEPVEEDPAADFLAREQDELASLEGDGFTSVVPEPVEENILEVTSANDLFAQSTEAQNNDTIATEVTSDNDLFTQSTEAQNNDTIATEVSSENDFLTLSNNEMEEPSNDTIATENLMPASVSPLPSDVYSAISQADKVRQEPEKLTKWREEQKEILEDKDKAAEVKRAEWFESAKHELEEWYKHSASQFEKTKVLNRESEASFIEERDENIPGHEWERICRLCEFNPKHSGNKKDVSRMRSILLQLKQQPLVR